MPVADHVTTLEQILEKMSRDIAEHEKYHRAQKGESVAYERVTFGHPLPFPMYAFHVLAKEVIELKAAVAQLQGKK